MTARPATEVEDALAAPERQGALNETDVSLSFREVAMLVDEQILLAEPFLVPLHYSLLTVTVLPAVVMK